MLGLSLKKVTPTQVFSWENCEIFRNSVFQMYSLKEFSKNLHKPFVFNICFFENIVEAVPQQVTPAQLFSC